MSRSNKKQQEGVIFIVNTGRTSNEIQENETESFFEKSKKVIKQILERKIFLRKNDTANIICFGANDTDNDENIDNIYQFEPELRVPTWEMVQRVLDLNSTNKSSNWVEALHVAINFVKNKCNFISAAIKVIILNNFQEDPNEIEQFDAETIANEVREANVDLMFITSTDEENVDKLTPSHKLALDVCKVLKRNTVCAITEEINNYLLETRFYKNPPVKPTPWRCTLQIGKIKIPTETYVKITEPPPFPSWKLTTRSDSVGHPPESEVDVKRSKELVDRYRNVTDESDAIKGYKYGGSFIPLSEEDAEKAKFKGTQKSLIVRGFVKQDEVSIEYWFGKGAHVVVPENSPGAMNKFYSLLVLMKKSNLVAIVRKVYQTNSLPKMVVWFPRLEEGEIACFVQVGIPFAEERRILNRRPQVPLPIEDKQKDVEDYINSMTLPEDDESLKPGSFCNPFKQHKWDYLSHRALNQDPLPPMDTFLLELISPQESLVKASEPVLERIAEWVKPKVTLKKEEPKEKEDVASDNNVVNTEEEMIEAAEKAEKENKNREELFNEIDESSMRVDEDLLDDM